MKKVLALLLALVMILSLSASAFADKTKSVCAPEEDPKKTSDLPKLIDNYLKLTSFEHRDELTDEQQCCFLVAKNHVSEVVPEGMAVRYLVYAVASSYPATGTIELSDFSEVAVKIFQYGKWEDVSTTVNDDGTISIVVNHEGALAIFTK